MNKFILFITIIFSSIGTISAQLSSAGTQDPVIINGISTPNPVQIPVDDMISINLIANTNQNNEGEFHGISWSIDFASMGVQASQVGIDYSNSGMGVQNSTMIVLDSANDTQLDIAMTKTNSNYTSGSFELCTISFPIGILNSGEYQLPITISSANNANGDNIACIAENILIEIQNTILCQDPSACNFQEQADCIFPELNLDCDGNCLNDTNDNGLCDELETSGCTNQTACNYNPNATFDDNSCVFANEVFDCDGNCILDSDNDGICDQNEAPDGSSFCGTNTTWDPITQTCIGISSCPTDLNNDGITNISDLFTLLGSFGLPCQ